MAKKRYLVEFGTGVDVHGMDVSKAAAKALRDAISHCCMVGLTEYAGLTNLSEQISLDVVIACPHKEKLDVQKALSGLPAYKHINVKVVDGGMEIDGMDLPGVVGGRTIIVVNAGITVWVGRVSKIRFLTDSGCDLPADMIARANIDVIPFSIECAGKIYREGTDLTAFALYDMLENESALPTTTQINAFEIVSHYGAAFDEGYTDLVVWLHQFHRLLHPRQCRHGKGHVF